MHKMRDVGIITGRFNPLHNGDVEMIQKALMYSRYGVIINFCSSCQERTIKNPLTVGERMQIVAAHFDKEIAENRILFCSSPDFPEDYEWVSHVFAESADACFEAWGTPLLLHEMSYAVWTSGKDGDGQKRKNWFSGMCPVEVVTADDSAISATDIRKAYFLHGFVVTDWMPEATKKFLVDFHQTVWYSHIRKQYWPEEASK
jgi:nicotinamide mononucleotide adenylyltransferase